jgi:hypothetical protein
MKWNAQEMQEWLVRYQRERILPEEAVPVVQCWIEVQLARYGKELDRDDAAQELWLYFIENLLPRLNVNLHNWHVFTLICIRHEIYRMCQRKKRYNRTSQLRKGIESWQNAKGPPARRAERRNRRRRSCM